MTRAEMIKAYMWLVTAVVKQMPHASEDTQELISEGTIGLVKAVDRYDTMRKVKFSTFASKCIQNEVRGFYRKNQARNRVTAVPEEEAADVELAVEMAEAEEERRELFEALRCLKKRERVLIDLQFGFSGREYSQQEIAEFLGVSQSTVSRERKRILLHLREELMP